MAYSTNPNLPKARAFAMQMLICEKLPLSLVARKCGVHRSTVWRWKRKWDKLNMHITFTNPNRPSRPVSVKNKLVACRWQINTMSSRPFTNPRAVSDEVVRLVLEIRYQLKRCAEVIWHYLIHKMGVIISLSSVKRIFRRHHIYDRNPMSHHARRVRLPRPAVLSPGSLIQTDTIHLIDPFTMKRTYVYTVIDLYTRMAYVKVHSVIRSGLAAKTIFEAERSFGFKFKVVQADNGSEFSSYFEQALSKASIAVRHSRLGRPNDNAHIERFNRTIQEECTGRYYFKGKSISKLQSKINTYLDYYNNERVHLGIQLKTPVEMLQRS